MELDARRLPDGSTLEADLCIVGAGPAGITLARELMGAGISVLLLESGGLGREPWAQDLNDGTVAGGHYAGLRTTRHRQAGGTARLWNSPVARENGAKYVPLDSWDFVQSATTPWPSWPLQPSELLSCYQRAQVVCGLGPFAYEAPDWADPARPPLPLDDGTLTTRVYQFGKARPFIETYPDLIRRAPGIRLCLGATVCRLETDASGRRVVKAYVGTHSGRRHTVVATRFVLATGAIENARLLLVSDLGNRHDLVGRFFMEHPRDHGLALVPASERLFAEAAFYDIHPGRDGTLVGGRLALTERAIREFEVPNASVTLFPRLRPPPSGRGSRLAARLSEVLSPRPGGGYGWSGVKDARHFDGVRLLVNLEQRPHPENRITLGDQRDALGVPRAALRWSWRPEEQAGMVRLRGLIAASLEGAGLGRVEIRPEGPPDPNAHHHAGTTRMSEDERLGVVDPSGRVHGLDNLFVAGASVFPTVGFANPTLTIVALAIRLADHLKARG